jgi:CBS-domain-containing membrane protein
VAGLLCALFIPDPLLASSLAVGSAIALMYLADCLHPPGAATALMLVLSHTQVLETGWQWTLWMVVANAVGSLLLAILINNLIPGRHYPAVHISPPQPSLKTQIALASDDIEWALAQMDSALDISTEDLQDIYTLAIQHAELRQTPSRT